MQASEPAVSNADGLRRLLGNSLGFMGRRWAAAQTCLWFHPKPRKGHRPLTLFRWRDLLELVQSAVSIADAGHPLGNSLGFMGDAGLPPRPAQGLTPPLHPRKGHRPLTRFRWRVPFGLDNYAEMALPVYSW